jgi:putative beta-barrel porin BBP2
MLCLAESFIARRRLIRARTACQWLCTVVLVGVGAASPVRAQTDIPEDAHRVSETLALSPQIRLADLGWDDNVLRLSPDAHPKGDFTTTLSPALQWWLRLPHASVNGGSKVDFVYFKELTNFRSIDADNAVRADFLVGRLKPYVAGTWINTRQRQNYEIDLPVRRLETAWNAGVDVELTGKTSIGATIRQFREDYRGETQYLDSDLAQYLDATTTAGSVRIRYAATPLTTVGADVEQYENRFATARERDSRGLRVTSVVEFRPRAQVDGRAAVGVVRRSFLYGDLPEFTDTVASVDLGYVLLGRTRFGVGVQRDLSFSYRPDQRDYLQTGIELSILHRLTEAWDVGMRWGRFLLDYDTQNLPGTAAPTERVINYNVDVGYRVGAMRVGLQLARQSRTSDFSTNRGYEQTTILSSLIYGF